MKKWYIFIFLVPILYGCRKEPISWDVDALFPILHTQMNLQKAIPEDMINVINGNELQLVYQGNLIHLELDSSLMMPDTSISDTFDLPFGSIVLQPGQTFLSDSNFTRYDFGNARLTHLYIHSGNMDIQVSSTLEGPSVLEYSLPTMVKNGIPFFVKENIPASSGNTPVTILKSFDLSGYEITLTGLQNNDYNVIASKYRAYIDSSSSPVTITSGQKFTATNSLNSIIPDYIRGSFGTEITNHTAQNEPIDIFQNIKGGTLSLESAHMVFEIKNEVGVDATIQINKIEGVNTINNTTVTLTGPLSSGAININRATETNGIFSAPYATKNLTDLTSSNSNITEFISNVPNQLNYDFEVRLNPLGNISNSNDFIYQKTGIEINLDAKIPLNFNANNLIFVDTSEFSIDTTTQEDVNQIIGGNFKIYTTNWYPFDMVAQFYLLDANRSVIDSIFEIPQTIHGGIPIFGVVDDPIVSAVTAPVTPSKIENLYKTESIISNIKVNSTDTGNIRILDYYFIDAKIVGDFQYQFSIK